MERVHHVMKSIFSRGAPDTPDASVQSLYIYPVKGCRGISVPQAPLSPTGFRWDRQWMVVNSNGRMLTQRVEPKLALVQTSLPLEAFTIDWEPTADSYLCLKAPGMDPLRVPLLADKTDENLANVSVWEWSGSALDEGTDVANYFSTFLGKPSRLVRFNTVMEVRETDADYAHGYKTTFTDGFPFLMISQGSLDELNHQLSEPLAINRFRPNILIENCGPFAEDLWKTFRINGLTFHGVKLCSRCKVTTVDQETGLLGEKEPLKSLAKFRSGVTLFSGKRLRSMVYFGQNVICEECIKPMAGRKAIVNRGDSVYVTEKYASTVEAPA